MARGTIADFINELGLYHSKNRYDAINADNQLGRFALSEAALIEIGMVGTDGDPHKNDYAGGWTGKHGIYSKEEFLNSPDAQDRAIHNVLRKLRDDAGDLVHYDGQIVDGYEIRISGILGALASIDAREIRHFIAFGGEYNPKWPNAPRISEIIRRFNDYDLPYKLDQNHNYTFTGSEGPDAIHGYAGNDHFTAKGGDDTFDGGDGVDTIVLAGKVSEFTITRGLDTATLIIKRKLDNGRVEHKEMRNVELVKFADEKIVDLRNMPLDAWNEEPTTEATVHIATMPVPIVIPLAPSGLGAQEDGISVKDSEMGMIGVRKEDEPSDTLDI
ncbi:MULTISPECIES: hypothetical protein [unclassified Chelatococcus]|uniref:hypothetical protein n=1 Tax=unclassified Chelatococcus TaxID=2638111 RepID=UPI001BD05C91|nr:MULTISPECIES: hypothetical protein [unclassified Chelatococcus]CAH1648764.1 conserved hypothetical protein [Hyphomicrobiales bacterium]MBS7741870.1 hypothetical protein [Chelatococcus sp. HY11]MBX3541332.1 hypothetical protein [Chelatococcus sp.]MCO5074775.1 hypothetical protein [Chelatococcus sp.]CAH1691384.1 conserved hypothetical protein [Hyphomicrobiales bacterium]